MGAARGDTAIANWVLRRVASRRGMGFMYKITGIELYRVTKYCGFDNFMKQMLRSSIYIFSDACYNHLEVCEKEHG